jgi:alpha-tubulin suppressor-like RCC1 family protein
MKSTLIQILLLILNLTWLTGTSGALAQPPLSPSLRVEKVIVCEYRVWYIASDSNIYGWNNGSRTVVKFPIGGRKAVDGDGAFNEFRVLDDQGYIWSSRIDFSANTDRYDTDTTGAPFDKNVRVFAYQNTTLTIRSDGSVWYFGNDDYHLLTPAGANNLRPIQLSPKGMIVKKLALGGYRIVALTKSGQVYEWTYGGGKNPVKKTIPAPAIDIFASHFDYAGCIIPTTPGAAAGYPYIWGTAWGSWGSKTPAAYPQPTPVKDLWKVKAPIKEISVDWNTTHYIDTRGDMYGFGFNAQGEVGNGEETVNKHHYPTFPGYGWSFKDSENPVPAPAVQIGKGIKWSRLFSNNWFGFYKYALAENGDLYSWGRNKAMVLGNGLFNLQQMEHPNALDVLVPTRVTPLTTIFQTYNFQPPSIHATVEEEGGTITLKGAATPLLLVKSTPRSANGLDTIDHQITSWRWKRISGKLCTISRPDSPSTTVAGLTPGTYVFQLTVTDSNTGTQNTAITVSIGPSGHIKKD